MPPTTTSRPPIPGAVSHGSGSVDAGMFRLWLEEAPDGILCTGPDGRIIFGNACICEMLGYSEQEFCRLEISDTYDPAEAHIANVRVKAAEVGVVNTCERRMRRKDGTFLPVEIKYARLANGTMVGVARDITARKRQEQRVLVQIAVAKIIGAGGPTAETIQQLLQAIGECLGWDYSAIWDLDVGDGFLRCRHAWQRQPARTGGFASASQRRGFKRGSGMVGRAAADENPVWVPDVTREADFPRASVAALSGLRSAFAFPIHSGGRLVAIVEFLSHDLRGVDEFVLETLRGLAGQIGRWLERGPRQ